ncbi:hypothetical protein [Vibrio sp. OPT18]|uniref:hypothetical protein n=1 Tax=Vibrio sp. OPT18 TaxID=2778641 RepID=UPI001882D699|nr:hypothetical protein [Vibrio sp. OPT18]MBE8576437.1 hypothetical protein [Vibrio sp. OPT18]
MAGVGNRLRDNKIFIVCVCVSSLIALVFIIGIKKLGFPDSLDKVSDAIASLTSALAFVWVVGGLFIQQSELSLSRDEYTRLRHNSDDENSSNKIQMTLSTLEHLIDVFDSISDNIFSVFMSEDKYKKIPKYYKIHSFCELCMKSQSKNDTHSLTELRRMKKLYGPVLNKYHSVYEELSLYISSIESDPKKLSNMNFLSNTVYSDVMNKIQVSSEKSKIIYEIINER